MKRHDILKTHLGSMLLMMTCFREGWLHHWCREGQALHTKIENKTEVIGHYLEEFLISNDWCHTELQWYHSSIKSMEDVTYRNIGTQIIYGTFELILAILIYNKNPKIYTTYRFKYLLHNFYCRERSNQKSSQFRWKSGDAE